MPMIFLSSGERKLSRVCAVYRTSSLVEWQDFLCWNFIDQFMYMHRCDLASFFLLNYYLT